MKCQYDEEKLTSYVLGELPAAEVAEIEYAVAADAALRLAVEEMEKFQVDLSQMVGGVSDKLLPRHKAAIMREAREVARGGKVIPLASRKRAKVVYFWPFAAAAVVGMGIFVMTLVGNSGKAGGAKTVANGGNGKDEREEGQGDSLLGVEAEGGSLGKIIKAVRSERRMPLADEVDVKELLKEFPLNAKEVVALWKGCSMGVEVVACPWKPSSNLVFVSLKGAEEGKNRISVRSVSGSGEATGIKMLGVTALNDEGLEIEFVKGESIYMALILDGTSGDIGSLEWSVDGVEAPKIKLIRNEETEASADAKFATLIAAYGMWLRKDEGRVIDEEVVLGLAREAAAENMVADRYDFLELVNQSVGLAGE
jgi:hypothetical protein